MAKYESQVPDVRADSPRKNAVARKRGRPFDAVPPFAMPMDLLGFNIVRLAHLKKMRDDAIFRAALGIGLTGYGTLMILSKSPGLGAGQLARWLLITPQSTAAVIAEMQRLRLIEKEKGRRKRGSRIKLLVTPKGKSLIERGQEVLDRVEAEVRVALTPAQANMLNKLLIQVAEAYTDLARREQMIDSLSICGMAKR